MREMQLVEGLGQGGALYDSLAKEIVKVIEPSVMSIVKKSAVAAEPTIRTVIREEVMPKVGMYAVLGIVLVGVSAAFIGSYMATRPRSRRR